jgi:tellurite resistance protein
VHDHQSVILEAARCVAIAGGTVRPTDAHRLRELVERAGIDEASCYTMINRAASEPNYVDRQRDLLAANIESALSAMVGAAEDGRIHPDDRDALRRFAALHGVGAERFERIVRAARGGE